MSYLREHQTEHPQYSFQAYVFSVARLSSIYPVFMTQTPLVQLLRLDTRNNALVIPQLSIHLLGTMANHVFRLMGLCANQ